MTTDVRIAEHVLMPGQGTTLTYAVPNPTPMLDRVTAALVGIDATWARFPTPALDVLPNTTGLYSVRIEVPANAVPGTYSAEVQITSLIDPSRHQAHQVQLVIPDGPELVVVPRESVLLDVDITNTADVIDGVTAVVDGVDSSWVQLPVPIVNVFPGSSASYAVRFDVPSAAIAGTYPIVVRLVSKISDATLKRQPARLTVLPHEDATLTLSPTVVTGGKRAELRATVINKGNCPLTMAVTAIDDTRSVACQVLDPAIVIEPGEAVSTPIVLRGRRPWFGQTQTRLIGVTA